MHLTGLRTELQHVSHHGNPVSCGTPLCQQVERRFHRSRVGVIAIVDDMDAMMGHDLRPHRGRSETGQSLSNHRTGQVQRSTHRRGGERVGDVVGTMCLDSNSRGAALSREVQAKGRSLANIGRNPARTNIGHF